jgi:peptidylprolyl isomerase
MNRFVLFLSVAAFATSAVAQTPVAKPATTAKPASSTPNPSTAKPATAAASAPELQPWIKLPPGVPRVVHGLVKIPFALRYEDIKVGTGAAGETGKIWHLKYTGWRAADGVKFDSWDDHRQPKTGPDGKPVMGPDGKPVLGDPVPISIPQGMGRVIPGFDYGLEGMKVGGKRRIFIPWQMAYGTRAIPDHPERPGSPAGPGIPAKSDLIFDVELVDQTDMPQPPQMSRPGGMPGSHSPITVPVHPGGPPATTAPSAPAAPPAAAPAASAPTHPAAPAQTTPPAPPSGVQAQPQPK